MIREAKLCGYWVDLSAQYRARNEPTFRHEGVPVNAFVNYAVERDGLESNPKTRAALQAQVNDLITDRFMEPSLDSYWIMITARGRRLTKGGMRRWIEYANIVYSDHPAVWFGGALILGWLTSPFAQHVMAAVWRSMMPQ